MRSAPPRRRRHCTLAALVGGGLVALAAGAYVGGFIPDFGAHARREASAWEAVRTTRDVAARKGYLAAHPDGAHAPEARARISGLLAEARQAVEVERARLRAGEAEAARVKAETEAARVKLEAEAAKKRAETRPAPENVAAVPPRARQARFDGVWVGEANCPEWRGRPGFRRPQRVTVQNGEMNLELTLPGRPQSFRSSGKIADDDSIELRGPGIGRVGKLFEHVLKGRFSEHPSPTRS